MRLMSFALTTNQVLNQTKTVTRRLGWANAKVGDIVQPVEKGQGLKRGEKVKRIGPPIRFTSVRRERLRLMHDERYGYLEAQREGFPDLTGKQFVADVFCGHNRGRTPDTEVTRIEFEYLPGE